MVPHHNAEILGGEALAKLSVSDEGDRFLRLIMSQNKLRTRSEALLFLSKKTHSYKSEPTPDFAKKIIAKKKGNKHIRIKNIDEYFSKLSGD